MMTSRKFKLHDGKVGSALAVRLTSKASRDAVVEIMEDGTVRIHVTAPPDDGQDNRALVSLLAGILNIPESKLDIVAGETGRDKLLSVLGVDAVSLTTRLREHLR